MFDRLKAENEQRKMEVHGLKDILVRENDHRIRETEELRMAMELSAQKLGEALERECNDMDQVRLRLSLSGLGPWYMLGNLQFKNYIRVGLELHLML